MWTNWAGNQRTQTPIKRPTSISELQQAVAQSGTLRVVGAGHSFTPIVAGGDRILDLSDIDLPVVGEVGEDKVWVNANARLRDLSPALAGQGMAFRNLGDINTQSLAGAVSTATHGTGRSLPCLAAEITAAKLVSAGGDILTTDDIPLEMAQVTLGMLGILTEAQISVVPKYNLRRRVRLADLQDCIANMHQNWVRNRNFEFFYIPFTGKAVELRHEISDAAESRAPRDLDMIAVKVLKLARNVGRLSSGLRDLLLRLLTMAQSDEDYVGESWRVLCSDRHIRFKEMEYHLPPDVAQDVLQEVITRLHRDHKDIYFPIEVRQTAGDSACLSPFQGGPRISIAIHTDADEDHRRYFDAIEPLFVEAGGRPHWGKMHSLAYAELSTMYPDFDRFCGLREQLDPSGKFLMPALARAVSTMTNYLQSLSETLRAYVVDKPVAVVDLDRLDANCALAVDRSDDGLGRRLVAKSLPCLPLLDHIRGLIQTSGLMTFSEPMLLALLKAEPKADHLIGKPLPVRSAARVLSECPDAAARVQWLIDSSERLQSYLALAADRQLALRLSLEVDIGLHRGGFQPDQVARIAQEIETNPNARLSGVMGYEAHLAKLPHFLRKRAIRASADAFDHAVSNLPNEAKGLCLNTGGSLTFQSYRTTGKTTEIAFGSVLVKPTDFDHKTTQGFQPAAFIATPVLKTMPGNSLPGLDFLARRKTDLAIFGGYFRAKPVFPNGFGYSSIFGRSTNQEVWTGPPDAPVKPGDIALLHPSQSEAVLNQFGIVLAVRGGQVVDEWECLPN